MIEFNITLLIQFFNLLVLLFLLNFLLFKPVLKAINKREKTLGSLFDNVDDTKQEAVKLEQAYVDGTTKRKKPILDDKESALMDARKTSMSLIETARAELSDELSKVKAEIERESKSISDALRGEVDKLSTEVAEKILKRSL
jgi:F-type H+-transporting ATPase subunit b